MAAHIAFPTENPCAPLARTDATTTTLQLPFSQCRAWTCGNISLFKVNRISQHEHLEGLHELRIEIQEGWPCDNFLQQNFSINCSIMRYVGVRSSLVIHVVVTRFWSYFRRACWKLSPLSGSFFSPLLYWTAQLTTTTYRKRQSSENREKIRL